MSEEILLESLRKDNEVPTLAVIELDVLPDAPDICDRIYDPALLDPKLRMDPPGAG